MITASHNPIEDNGVKMIDADGGMLARDWETVREMRGRVTCEVVTHTAGASASA